MYQHIHKSFKNWLRGMEVSVAHFWNLVVRSIS